ncbi:DUF4097 family beta strand repeat-containing protein [Alkalihalobacillus hemicellulosilyticus]|uniref:DUF4097 domain-containing protein n=1 Tax=Halalkalibacter hemicellulosilyticusJCM 9152 TaxID=1236971 RepID=W4QE98_9BACI|nr:DUF4097 family beta strand repeat-containing protein [Halalkalibacter hemicellulosilyticus]GAE30381.1 hypothetical protein JCM9152_1787 [Halalkalibacter hemicellulosilyticusJCM 9152]
MKSLLGVALIIIGVIVVVSAVWPAWSTMNKDEVGDYLQEPIDQLNEVKLSGVAVDWQIEASDSSSIEVELVNKHNRTNMYSSVQNGTLTVEIKREQRFAFLSFDFSFQQEQAIARIPAEYIDSLEVHSVSGDILIRELSRLNSIALKTVSGDLKADSLTIDSAAVFNTTSGDILIESVLAEEVKAETVSGDISIPTIQGTLVAKTTSGDIHAEFQHEHKEATLRTISGDVLVGLANANADLSLKTTSGDLMVVPSLSNQQLSNREISGKIGEGEYPVSVTTTSGDIVIK